MSRSALEHAVLPKQADLSSVWRGETAFLMHCRHSLANKTFSMCISKGEGEIHVVNFIILPSDRISESTSTRALLDISTTRRAVVGQKSKDSASVSGGDVKGSRVSEHA
jgi:hypothetical protein